MSNYGKILDKRNRIWLVSTRSNFMTTESQFDLSRINKEYFSKNTNRRTKIIGVLWARYYAASNIKSRIPWSVM